MAQPINQHTSIEQLSVPSDIKTPLIERYGITPVLFAFISLIVIFILYQIIGGIITILLFGYKPSLSNIFGYRIATGLGQILFIFLPTLILVRFASFEPSRYLRLRMPTFQEITIPIVGIFSLQQMLQIYLVFQDRIPFPEEVQSLMEKFKEIFEEVYKQLVSTASIPELLSVIFIVALIPAVAEEFMFRGLIQRNFEKGLTSIWGVIASGVVFGIYHLNPFSFIPLAIIGIYLGFLTFRSDSIWVSVIAHFINNSLACVSLYLNLNEDYVVFGNSESMSTGSLIFTFWFFGIVFIISTYYFVKITKRHQIKGPDKSFL